MYAIVMNVVKPARISVFTVVPFSFRRKIRSIVFSPLLLFCPADSRTFYMIQHPQKVCKGVDVIFSTYET